jgi:hypothetical protein
MRILTVLSIRDKRKSLSPPAARPDNCTPEQGMRLFRRPDTEVPAMSSQVFLVIVCLAFILAVCSMIFARPLARWLKNHSE